jgi:hypothetical protein
MLNCTYEILKTRPQFTYPCVEAFLKWERNRPTQLSKLDMKNVLRNLKIILLSCYSLESCAKFTEPIKHLATIFGAKPHEFQLSAYRASKRSKSGVHEKQEIVTASELEPDLMEALIANMNQLPLHVIVDTVIQTFLSHDQQSWDAEVRKYLSVEFGIVFETAAVAPVEQPKPKPAEKADLDKILGKAKVLGPEDLEKQIRLSARNVFEMESNFAIPTSLMAKSSQLIQKSNDNLVLSRFRWMLIAIRLATRSSSNTIIVKDEIMKFIAKDFVSRMEIALFWLHEEFFNDQKMDTAHTDQIVDEILDNMRDGSLDAPGLDPTDRTFTRFLVEIPKFTPKAMERVIEYCVDPSRMQLGIATLRDLIVFRPALKDTCLNLLLEYSHSLDKQTRTSAIECLLMFIPTHIITDEIIEFAKMNVTELHNDSVWAALNEPNLRLNAPLEDAQMNAVDENEQEEGEAGLDPMDQLPKTLTRRDIISSQIGLFLGCVYKSINLLNVLQDIFIEFPKDIQTEIINEFKSWIVQTTEFDSVCEFVTNFKPGSEELVYTILATLIEHEQVFETAKMLYLEKDLDPRFLNLIVHALDRVLYYNLDSNYGSSSSNTRTFGWCQRIYRHCTNRHSKNYRKQSSARRDTGPDTTDRIFGKVAQPGRIRNCSRQASNFHMPVNADTLYATSSSRRVAKAL